MDYHVFSEPANTGLIFNFLPKQLIIGYLGQMTGNSPFFDVSFFSKTFLPVQTRIDLIPKNPVPGLEMSKIGSHN